jgi:hypothetical protein
VLGGGFAAGAIDEDLSHGGGGGGEEVAPAAPAWIAVLDELDVGLVHERGGLKRLARRGAGQAGAGQAVQLLVEHRQHLGGRGRVAVRRCVQHLRQFVSRRLVRHRVLFSR